MESTFWMTAQEASEYQQRMEQLAVRIHERNVLREARMILHEDENLGQAPMFVSDRQG